MSTIVTMAEAQAHLPELVAHLGQGEEIIITENQQPVAKLVAEPAKSTAPAPGLAERQATWDAIKQLWRESSIDSQGKRPTRDQLHERR